MVAIVKLSFLSFLMTFIKVVTVELQLLPLITGFSPVFVLASVFIHTYSDFKDTSPSRTPKDRSNKHSFYEANFFSFSFFISF